MSAANVISIEITTTDKAGLSKLAKDAVKAGKEIEEGLGKGIDAAERKTKQSADQMSTAFKGAIGGMTRELDKLERGAALSGEGMSAEYADALAKVRGDLVMVSAEAAKTGRNFDEGLSGALRSIQRGIGDLRPEISKIDKTFDQTARQVGRYLYQIERDAWQSGKGMDDAFTTASRSIRDDLNKIRAEAAKTGADLSSELGTALKKVSAQADQLHKSIKPPEKAKSGGGGGILGDLLGDAASVKGGALAVGTAAASFIWKGLQAEWKEDAVGGLLAAQTGAAQSAAEGLGDTAGRVFGDNFGDSIEEVGEAMHAVFEQKLINPDAASSDIQSVTEKVMTLATITGESFDAVARNSEQLVKTGLVGNISQAMDLIGAATEHGLNAADDLLDTVEEYSTKFRDLGLNGQQAFGLIEQSMDAGARNTDIAADALKEFSIRAQDGSVLTRRGFEAIGLDADKMGKMVASGGDSATSALRQTLNALQAMPPGVERSTAAVDLFGTKAEDLGDALYHMDLDNAADKFENFGGTVEEQMKKISDSTSFWDKLGRGVSNAASGLGEFLDYDVSDMLDDFPELRDRMEEVNKAQQDFDATGSTHALDDLKKKYPELSGAIDDYIEKKRQESGATDEATESNVEYVRSLQQIIDATTQQAEGILGLSDAQIAYNQDVADGEEAVKKFAGQGLTAAKDGFDLSTEAGRTMASALNDVADGSLNVMDKMQAQGATTVEVQGFVQQARDEFIKMATDMGMSADAANALANKLGLVPGDYRASVTVTNYEQSVARAQNMINLISRIPTEKLVNLRVNASGSGLGGHFFAGQEHGGVVTRPHWSAASGGQRHSSTLINEAGPEVAELPNGTRMLTAGATRALADSGAFGGGGGATHVVLSWEGSSDPVISGIMAGLRAEIRNSHGGDPIAALGQS